MISGAGMTGLQRAFSSLLLFLMLLVSNAPFLNALASLQADCDAKCCSRNKKSCCCRKKAASSPGQSSPSQPKISVSARACPSGCGQFVAMVSVSLLHVAGGIAFSHHIPAVAALGSLMLLMLAAVTLCFSQFQRPPPGALLPFTV